MLFFKSFHWLADYGFFMLEMRAISNEYDSLIIGSAYGRPCDCGMFHMDVQKDGSVRILYGRELLPSGLAGLRSIEIVRGTNTRALRLVYESGETMLHLNKGACSVEVSSFIMRLDQQKDGTWKLVYSRIHLPDGLKKYRSIEFIKKR